MNKKHGKRVEVESYKENENDFTLWKPSEKDEPGWDSPGVMVGLDGTLSAQ